MMYFHIHTHTNTHTHKYKYAVGLPERRFCVHGVDQMWTENVWGMQFIPNVVL